MRWSYIHKVNPRIAVEKFVFFLTLRIAETWRIKSKENRKNRFQKTRISNTKTKTSFCRLKSTWRKTGCQLRGWGARPREPGAQGAQDSGSCRFAAAAGAAETARPEAPRAAGSRRGDGGDGDKGRSGPAPPGLNTHQSLVPRPTTRPAANLLCICDGYVVVSGFSSFVFKCKNRITWFVFAWRKPLRGRFHLFVLYLGMWEFLKCSWSRWSRHWERQLSLSLPQEKGKQSLPPDGQRTSSRVLSLYLHTTGKSD